MPEGPEVRRVTQDLAKELSGMTLESIEILSGRYTKAPIESLTEINSVLPTKIIGAGCHGKFIYIITSSGFHIWNTLGMSGTWSLEPTKHSRVSLNLSTKKKLYFNDIRNFGTLKIVYGKSRLIKKLTSLGPDMLAIDIDEDFFVSRMRQKDSLPITKVLMNQAVFSGIGNYVKAESLWLAKIDPNSLVEEISDTELKKLCICIKKILRESYNTGGATFKTFENLEKVNENYAERFLCYGRKIDAEGNLVIKTKTPDGRTTHWSPKRQGNKDDNQQLV